VRKVAIICDEVSVIVAVVINYTSQFYFGLFMLFVTL